MGAQIGPIRFRSLRITSEEGATIDLDKIPKGNVEPFVTALEAAINAVAIEPITINVKKGLAGQGWSFTKPAEMVLRSRPAAVDPIHAPAVQAVGDPLRALQMRLVNGEISKEQYEEMRKILMR